MSLTFASWNINSVRLRQELVVKFLLEHNIDILCLQETKCPNELFPQEAFISAGYNSIIYHGQKSYNGVAIIARQPLYEHRNLQFCGKDDCRHISAEILLGEQKILLHNFYVPAGGEIPDVDLNEKFKHKLQFLQEMEKIKSVSEKGLASLLVGDLNIAPQEADVWSHKELLNVVSHTQVETEALAKVQKSGEWVDLVRHHFGNSQKIYSWWSYRAKDWRVSDRGRRLDHIWGHKTFLQRMQSITIAKELRGSLQPSDHVPIIACFS